MTPALPDILRGHLIALNAPAPPEAAGEYLAGRLAILAMLSALAAQEAERGIAARVWENGAIRSLLAAAVGDYGDALGGRLADLAEEVGPDLSWSALDGVNARLRRALIALHEAVEARGDQALDRAILALYLRMAHERRLDLAAAMAT